MKIINLVYILLLTLFITACGGGSDNSSQSPTPTPTPQPTSNSTPTAIIQSITVDEDSSISIVLTGIDSDGTIASYSNTVPTNGVLSGTAPNLTYTPNANFFGSDSFSFTVTDNAGSESQPAIISITVTDVPEPSSAPNITVTPATATVMSGTGADFSISVSDSDGLSGTFSVDCGVPRIIGSNVNHNPPNSLFSNSTINIPNIGQDTTFSCTVLAEDTLGNTGSFVITLNITGTTISSSNDLETFIRTSFTNLGNNTTITFSTNGTDSITSTMVNSIDANANGAIFSISYGGVFNCDETFVSSDVDYVCTSGLDVNPETLSDSLTALIEVARVGSRAGNITTARFGESLTVSLGLNNVDSAVLSDGTDTYTVNASGIATIPFSSVKNGNVSLDAILSSAGNADKVVENVASYFNPACNVQGVEVCGNLGGPFDVPSGASTLSIQTSSMQELPEGQGYVLRNFSSSDQQTSDDSNSSNTFTFNMFTNSYSAEAIIPLGASTFEAVPFRVEENQILYGLPSGSVQFNGQ